MAKPTCARLLAAQKHRLRQLDAHWKKVSDELKGIRLKRDEGDQRELMKLENRLSSCRTRESKMVALNADLQQRVDELRASRVLSQSIFEKNQRKLREIQRQMQESFRASTQIMAERDRILAQAYSLTHTNMEEQEGFDSVFQSLAAIIKRERENAKSYRKHVLEQNPMDLSDDFVRGNLKFEDEVQLKNSLKKLDMNIRENSLMEDKQPIESISDRLQEFGRIFTVLQQMETDDYHDLVPVYTKEEEENFALFRYVKSISNEIEQLEDEKHAIERETQKLNSDMKDGNAHARKRIIDDLVEVRQKILKENSEYEWLRAAASREFQPIARAVDRLYNALSCNDVMAARINSMNDLLAAHGITEGNILQCLAIIEKLSRRLQHKNPMESSCASLGANLWPSDSTRSIIAARAILLDASGNIVGTGNNNVSNNSNSSTNNNAALPSPSMTLMSSILSSGANFSGNSIAKEDSAAPNESDDDDSDRPMTMAELQRRAAKSAVGLQAPNAKLQPARSKAAATKKKK